MFEVFYKAVSLKRAAGSLSEAEFVGWLANRHPPDLIDEAGNLHYDRRLSGERTLFVAHTDTAHSHGGANKYEVRGDEVLAQGDVLGADDAAGLQILCHLMEASVPGYYIFTRAEEVGGVGARYLAEYHPSLLEQFDRAIAFDRKDTWSIITHQGGNRCASSEFAEALSEQLSQQGLIYAEDDTGIFTDTALWVGLIPECTNLSCGYWSQHTSRERQSMTFLHDLMQAAAQVSWEQLPVVRSCRKEIRLDPHYQDLYDALTQADNGKVARLKHLMYEYGYVERPITGRVSSLAGIALWGMSGVTEDEVEQAVVYVAARATLAKEKDVTPN